MARRSFFEVPMKTWMFAALSLVMTLGAGAASACPVGAGNEPIERPRPVVTNVSFQASQLFERAQQLETNAASHERSATEAAREAETLTGRARLLRNQASLPQLTLAERQSLLGMADELATRAATAQAQAGEHRRIASDLRAEARIARERGLQLVRTGGGTGGGWGGRGRPKAPTATTASVDIGM
ncbi:MAG: hypothetical protein JST00_09645 [Deltaproteobacteria bacterium]|nr:hypothetical protein [Deltaproteobacteria bacterium]